MSLSRAQALRLANHCMHVGQTEAERTLATAVSELSRDLNIAELNADNTGHALVALARQLADMEKRKDNAYEERNKVVAALSKVFPACRSRTAIEGWSEDWHGCVYIDLPTGQASWHYHDSQAHLFEHLPFSADVKWDGHTTEEKYARLAELESYRPTFSERERADAWSVTYRLCKELGMDPDKYESGIEAVTMFIAELAEHRAFVRGTGKYAGPVTDLQQAQRIVAAEAEQNG